MRVRSIWFTFFAITAAMITAGFYSPGISTFAEPQASERPPMFVLQVGIGRYLNAPKWADLRGSINDVTEMRKLLESERFRVPSANIITLTDALATKQKIFAAYQENLIAKAKDYFEKTKKRDAVVLFQYSGHGSQAPDADGDETDKLDETLVTYDSQDVQGKNFDITDDEIFALTSELKRYTDNIVYVFDSCHSGSGTRNAEDARRLPARTTIPESVAIPAIKTRSGNSLDDGANGTIMPPGSDYIVISAARAEQLATQKYCFEECGSDKEPVVYGLLTFYLIDELKNARNDTTYREIMENVSRKVVAERPTQVPVIEGDERRIVFGSLASAEDNFVPILSADAANIRIRAGAIQGVSVGSIVSFYDRAVKRSENAESLMTGKVASVTATESVVKIPVSNRAITPTDKAIIVSGDLGVNRSKVLLDLVDISASPNVRSVATVIRDSFASKNGIADERVEIVPNSAVGRQTGRWNIALLKDKYSKVFPKATSKTP
ncbi:MAG: caspase family protein, partial [Pyrinomonadaceae bacterium]